MIPSSHNNFEKWKAWQKKHNWKKKEKKDAKSFDCMRTPRSGGLWSSPGDISTDNFLMDSKQTKHLSYAVSAETIKKIYHEAIRSQKMPALSIQLGDNTEFIILRKDDFLSLINKKNI